MQAAALLTSSALLAMLSTIAPPLLGVELPPVAVALDPGNIKKASVDTLIAALPAPSIDKIWVKVRQTISIEELSSSLKLNSAELAALNDVDEDHKFLEGDWLIVPSQKYRQIRQLVAVDTSELRRTPPLQYLPPVEESAIVRFGDTVVKIALRYGLTLQELLRLNPGLETARLVVGSQVRIAQASSARTRMVLGLKPTTSGGISWPELPDANKNIKEVSSLGLVGPFKRNAGAFSRYLNASRGGWRDPSLRTYFFDLYDCQSVAPLTSGAPSGYYCGGGYVRVSDNLGSRTCRLSEVKWSWIKGASFSTTSSCR